MPASEPTARRRVLVTGGGGFLGAAVVRALAAHPGVELVVSADIRPADVHPSDGTLTPVVQARCDVRDARAVASLIAAHRVDTVAHLAAMMFPGTAGENLAYQVDVIGARNVLAACVAQGVRRIVVPSSAAAYGYHADNPERVTEDDPLRGNDDFTFSRHKRLVEELLADYRQRHPELEQVVLRIDTILGPGVSNRITALWDHRGVLALRGSDSPFGFVWVDDVVGAVAVAVTGEATGVFNVVGDGCLTVRDIARHLGKRTFALPVGLLAFVLRVGHALHLTDNGPERIAFLRHRPVLDNTRLKQVLGYTPRLTSAEAFDAYLASKRQR